MNLLSKEEILRNKKPISIKKNGVIYFLIKENEIIYIGKAKENAYSRAGSHLWNKDFDSISIIEYPENDLIDIETQYIKFFNPKLNIKKNYYCNVVKLYNQMERLQKKVGDERFRRLNFFWNKVYSSVVYTSHSKSNDDYSLENINHFYLSKALISAGILVEKRNYQFYIKNQSDYKSILSYIESILNDDLFFNSTKTLKGV